MVKEYVHRPVKHRIHPMDKLPETAGLYIIHFSDWVIRVPNEDNTSHFELYFDGKKWDDNNLNKVATTGSMGWVSPYGEELWLK